ncbi:MAG: hypothetical protein KAS32_06570 [Candidatus Peribacteraceae bacterium]|nr:hypothetical protein [Candidatus Peribacteraceae bacterium]
MSNSYMDYNNPVNSGQIAFLKGLSLEDNPCDSRTHANARIHWRNGWLKQSKLEHHRDSTIGLFATDMPKLFSDHPKFDLMFEIKD